VKSEHANRRIRQDNERNVPDRPMHWWKACSLIDVDQVRREAEEGVFLKRRMGRLMLESQGLGHEERQVLKELVGKEQLRRYRLWQRIERSELH
jgi:hypothetical protein